MAYDNGDTGTIEGVNGILYFDAITEENRRELWAHDPVDDSTWLIANLHKPTAEWFTTAPTIG